MMQPDADDDDLAREIGERLVPEIDGSHVIPADAVFAAVDANQAGEPSDGPGQAQRSQGLDEDDTERAEVDVVEPDDDEGGEPDIDNILAMAAEDDDEDDATRAAGHDVTPGNDELHHYWTRGPGLARWAESAKPWTTLLANLVKVVPDKPLETLKKWVSRWYIEVFHYAAGSDEARVAHGKPPRGSRVGPG